LKNFKVTVIDSREYLATNIRTLNGKKYQELCSANIMRPDILYLENLDGKSELVDDWDVYYALKKKYAICEQSLNGKLLLCSSYSISYDDLKAIKAKAAYAEFLSQSNGNTNSSDEKLFDRKAYEAELINAELAKLFESDVKEFFENGARAFGHILAKHGIDDPQKWFEERMRESKDPSTSTYIYAPSNRWAFYDGTTGKITFASASKICDKNTRAHEMTHKITAYLVSIILNGEEHFVGRIGFNISDAKITKNGKVICTGNGMGFDEAVTDLITEKLSEITSTSSGYINEGIVMRKVAEQVGEDIIFEAAFFGPKILADKWHQITGDRHSFAKIIHSLDENLRLSREYASIDNKREAKRVGILMNNAAEYAKYEAQKHNKSLIKRIGLVISLKFEYARVHFSRLPYKFARTVQDNIIPRLQGDSAQADIPKRKSTKLALQSVHVEQQCGINTDAVKQEQKNFKHMNGAVQMDTCLECAFYVENDDYGEWYCKYDRVVYGYVSEYIKRLSPNTEACPRREHGFVKRGCNNCEQWGMSHVPPHLREAFPRDHKGCNVKSEYPPPGSRLPDKSYVSLPTYFCYDNDDYKSTESVLRDLKAPRKKPLEPTKRIALQTCETCKRALSISKMESPLRTMIVKYGIPANLLFCGFKSDSVIEGLERYDSSHLSLENKMTLLNICFKSTNDEACYAYQVRIKDDDSPWKDIILTIISKIFDNDEW